jgi:hypothetical protein
MVDRKLQDCDPKTCAVSVSISSLDEEVTWEDSLIRPVVLEGDGKLTPARPRR